MLSSHNSSFAVLLWYSGDLMVDGIGIVVILGFGVCACLVVFGIDCICAVCA